MIRTVLFSTCALALVASTAEAKPFQPAQVPATADVVIHFDVDAFKRSRLHRMFRSEIEKGIKQLDVALLAKKIPLTAADFTDISGVTFWAEGADPERGALIASGVRVKRLLRAATKLPKFRIARHGGYVLSRIEVDGDDTFIGATSRVLVISDDKSAVAKTLDAITGKSKTLAGSSTARQLSQSNDMLVAAAFGKAVARKIRKRAGSPMFKEIELRRGAVFASEDRGGLHIKAILEHASAAGAEKLVRLGEAGLAVLSVGNDDPDVASLARGIKLAANGSRATLEMRIPFKLLRKMSRGKVNW